MSDIKRVTINTNDGSATVRLRNVRLSFPSLWEPKSFDGNGPGSYGATFLMPKEGDPEKNAEHVKTAVREVIKNGLKGKNPGADKLCIRDGDIKDHIDGYNNTIYFLSSSSKKAVPVVDRDLTPLMERDGKPYAGCYVNATVRLWPQDNQYGKRVNAQLRAIQFLRDGDPFGETAVDPEDEFEAVDAGGGADDLGDDIL